MGLDIASEMRAFDKKDRNFFDKLTPDERKQFSTFLMIRWGSTVETNDPMMQIYYLQSTNEKLNKNFFQIKKEHDKLNWLAATTVSPDMGVLRHAWIKQKKADGSGNGKVVKFVAAQYPHLKDDEIDMLVQLNDVKTWKELAKDLGWTPEQIKKDLG